MRNFFDRRRRRGARRKFLSFYRRLGVEPLESRLALTILTVNSLADGPEDFTDAIVTLRDAIRAANNDETVSPGGPTGSGTDEIRFQPGLSGTILLTQDQMGLRSSLTITGPGANVLTVHGNNAYTVFDVADFVPTASSVTISGLTITGGSAPISSGGGIINRENLMVLNCTITGNSAGDSGGGIFSSQFLDNQNFPTLTVQNSTISGNSAGGGGGISNSGTVTIQNSTISGNLAMTDGGGIVTVGPTLIENSTITQNRDNSDDQDGVSGDRGGGIVIGNGAQAILHNSIIATSGFAEGVLLPANRARTT